jgi:hypothetical protein
MQGGGGLRIRERTGEGLLRYERTGTGIRFGL